MLRAPPLERLVPVKRVLAVVNLSLRKAMGCGPIVRHILERCVRSLATGAENVLNVRPKMRSKERVRKLQRILFCLLNASMSPTKIYVTAEVNGEPIRCLLDSGCERSVISADLVPNAELTPLQYTLYATNRANLDVLGDCVISFAIDGITLRLMSLCPIRLMSFYWEAIGWKNMEPSGTSLMGP